MALTSVQAAQIDCCSITTGYSCCKTRAQSYGSGFALPSCDEADLARTILLRCCTLKAFCPDMGDRTRDATVYVYVHAVLPAKVHWPALDQSSSQAQPRINHLDWEPAPRHSASQPAPITSDTSSSAAQVVAALAPRHFGEKSAPHPAGFLCQEGLNQVIWTWWTLFVSGWNIRTVAIHPLGNCYFIETCCYHGEKSGVCTNNMPVSHTNCM